MKHYLAIDLGATSGRTILAGVEPGRIELEEISRFPNLLLNEGGHYYWDIRRLYSHILAGLKLVAVKGIKLESIGIDTWGVDFALLDGNGELLQNPYAYRDPHTLHAPEHFFARYPLERLYEKTGIQVMNFNTLFQLDTMQRNADPALAHAQHILFLPDYINYLLTGRMATEYTIASTSQLLNLATRAIDNELMAAVGLSADMFAPMIYPGQAVGNLTTQVQQLTGLPAVPVIAVGSHDTASAVAAVPAEKPGFAYLSSGTWSLMGVELEQPVVSAESRRNNFTNEGGVSGNIRFLKNICGMWLLEGCRKSWGNIRYDLLTDAAMHSEPFRTLINPDDPSFAQPADMPEAIASYCKATNQPVPQHKGEFVRCILESLALRYRQVMDMLKEMTPFTIEVLHIIGGGSCNSMLNQFTANALGMEVVAGPAECTALGNVMMQAGLTRSRIAGIIDRNIYTPRDTPLWEAAYMKYLQVTNP